MSGVVAGADVGGSKADLAVISDGQPALGRTVPTAEWYRAGLPGVAAGLAKAFIGLVPVTALDLLVVGAHGCDDRDQCGRLAADIEGRLGVRTYVVNDAELVLPAAGVDSGVGLIIGTGSIAVGYDRSGEMIVVGGWGEYLGDEGSGTGLFRDAARAVTRGWDRGDREDPLLRALLELLKLSDLRDLPARLFTVSPTACSTLTPELFSRAFTAGSPLADAVLEDSVGALVELILVAGSRGANTGTVVAAGGLIKNCEWLRTALRAEFNRACPRSELRFLECAPLYGALALAEEMHRNGEVDRRLGWHR